LWKRENLQIFETMSYQDVIRHKKKNNVLDPDPRGSGLIWLSWIWASKNATSDAEFESVEKKCKKVHPKEVTGRKLLLTVIKVKNSIFCHFFADSSLA
jgi:hypothetical protein